MAKGKGDKGKGKGKGDEVPAAVASAASRLGVSILIALSLSYSALRDTLGGRATLVHSASRFLVCFIVARVATAIVWGVYEVYRDDAIERERARAAAEHEAAREKAEKVEKAERERAERDKAGASDRS